MKGSGTIIMVKEMHTMQGLSVSAIARELEMSRTTVRKYLRESYTPDKRVGTKRASKLDSFKPQIHNLMEQGIYNAAVILDRILEQGYPGGLSILKSYIQPFRPVTVKEGPAKRRYETSAGSQVQMDWGICKYVDLKGRVRKVACFVMILGYSRMRYVEFTRRCDLKSLLRCIVHAFQYFGGIPRQLLTDRMKTVVLRTERNNIVWQEGFERFASELGFMPKLCRVRRPQTKGKVERLVHYVKHNFMPGRQFIDEVDLNNQAQHWLKQVNNRVHGTTGEIPAHLLREEKLNPLPTDSHLNHYLWESRKVSLDGFVSYDGVKYGANWRYSGETLRVRVVDGRVLLVDVTGAVIQEHPQYRTGRKYVYAKGQYDGLYAADGQVKAPPYGRQVEPLQVETRDLHAYALIDEVS